MFSLLPLLLRCVILNDKVIVFLVLLSVGLTQLLALLQRTLQTDEVQNSLENRSCLNPVLQDLPSHSMHSEQSRPPW